MILTTYKQMAIGEVCHDGIEYGHKFYDTPFCVIRVSNHEEYIAYCLKIFGKVDFEPANYFYEVSVD